VEAISVKALLVTACEATRLMDVAEDEFIGSRDPLAITIMIPTFKGMGTRRFLRTADTLKLPITGELAVTFREDV